MAKRDRNISKRAYYRLLDDLVLVPPTQENLILLFRLPVGKWIASMDLFGHEYSQTVLKGADFFICWLDDAEKKPYRKLILFFDNKSLFSQIVPFDLRTLKQASVG